MYLPDPSWTVVALAALLLLDAVLSVKPAKFIDVCLTGVNFPRNWWWALIVIKLVAVAGLIIGIWVPGVALAATVGVIAYFLCAGVAHVRAKFLQQEFWVNCLGFLGSAVLVLIFAFIV
ncbi:DoxX family protein [Cellulomonas sp. URHD0024]|uniref:DoxX family protein n=1 Tax=Cellulomonas sp. URHD0024 TaxID=1302620 RepID=UPI000406CA39|nr:DoxX family protein [Cellulomonas sp. URHD0024]